MSDQVKGIDPIGPGQKVDLFFPDPNPGSVAMHQYERFPFAFDRKKDGMAIDLDRPGREGRVPVNSIGPNRRGTLHPHRKGISNAKMLSSYPSEDELIWFNRFSLACLFCQVFRRHLIPYFPSRFPFLADNDTRLAIAISETLTFFILLLPEELTHRPKSL